jgi:hypothetical protein
MTSNTVDTLLRDALAPARRLEPEQSEVVAVLLRVGTRGAATASPGGRRRATRALAPALAAALVLVAAAYAVPPTRAAIDDAVGGVAGVFDGWVSGDEAAAPGRAVEPGEPAPSYFNEGSWSSVHINDPRVIAEAGGYELFAYKERSGTIGFDLGDTGFGMGGFVAADFRHPLCVLGPGTTNDTDPQGPIPYFGITSPEAGRVEVSYTEGSPEEEPAGEGGFVALLDRGREPVAITAYDTGGKELGRVQLHFVAGIGGRPEPAAPSSAFC